MDPNNNQSNNQAVISQQPVGLPQSPAETPTQGVQYQNPNTNKGHKTTLFLIVLLMLVVGLTSYLIFVNLKNKTPQNISVAEVQVISPTSIPIPTPSPTPIAEDDLSVEAPEVDIKALDDAASTL